MWKICENDEFCLWNEFKLTSVNILDKRTRTRDLMALEGLWKNMGLGRISGIEFRGPKPEKWIFIENYFLKLFLSFGNEMILKLDGIGPVFWFQRTIQVLYVIWVKSVKFGKKRIWNDVNRIVLRKIGKIEVLKKFHDFDVKFIVVDVILMIWMYERVRMMF